MELRAVLSPQTTAMLRPLMDFSALSLFNPSLNPISVRFGLLSILCRVPVGRAGSWKNSSYLHSRFGGDRGSFAKGVLCQLALLWSEVGTQRPAGGGEGGFICRNCSGGDPQLLQLPPGLSWRANPPGVGSQPSAGPTSLIWVHFSSEGTKSGRERHLAVAGGEGRNGTELCFFCFKIRLFAMK